MEKHRMSRYEKALWRNAYGNSSEQYGTEYLVVCSCGKLQAATRDVHEIHVIWADHLADMAADERGYDRKSDFFVCRYDRTVTDDMDAHDRVCTGKDKR